MDKEWLTDELAAGRSIESIAREAGLDPSTVAYWAKKFGLESKHASKHRARGAPSYELMSGLVARDLTVRQIAGEIGRSPTTVRYWLARYGLETSAEARGRKPAEAALGRCAEHGEVVLVRVRERLACSRCRADSVTRWRRRAKRILVEEAGGRCVICGYDRCISALQFHHRDPSEKRFGLGSRGLAQSIERLRDEARKCVLLCANCHAEVEARVATIPADPQPPPG